MMLVAASYDQTPPFALEACAAKVIDVYDADTVTVAIEVLPGQISRWSVRIVGVDAPEIRPKRDNPHRALEKRAAIRCRDALIERLVGFPVRRGLTRSRVRTLFAASEKLVRLEPIGFDKYGRILGDIKLPDSGVSAKTQLIGGGFARDYGGGSRAPWTEEDLLRILGEEGANVTNRPVT